MIPPTMTARPPTTLPAIGPARFGEFDDWTGAEVDDEVDDEVVDELDELPVEEEEKTVTETEEVGVALVEGPLEVDSLNVEVDVGDSEDLSEEVVLSELVATKLDFGLGVDDWAKLDEVCGNNEGLVVATGFVVELWAFAVEDIEANIAEFEAVHSSSGVPMSQQ